VSTVVDKSAQKCVAKGQHGEQTKVSWAVDAGTFARSGRLGTVLRVGTRLSKVIALRLTLGPLGPFPRLARRFGGSAYHHPQQSLAIRPKSGGLIGHRCYCMAPNSHCHVIQTCLS
jgi:hypothetical protein